MILNGEGRERERKRERERELLTKCHNFSRKFGLLKGVFDFLR
jgi:hypothetical protein